MEKDVKKMKYLHVMIFHLCPDRSQEMSYSTLILKPQRYFRRIKIYLPRIKFCPNGKPDIILHLPSAIFNIISI